MHDILNLDSTLKIKYNNSDLLFLQNIFNCNDIIFLMLDLCGENTQGLLIWVTVPFSFCTNTIHCTQIFQIMHTRHTLTSS